MDKENMELFLSKLPEWKEALVRQMKIVELEEVCDRDLQRRIAHRKTTKERANARWAQARARRLEAKALLSAASEDYKKYLKQQATVRMAKDKEQEDSLAHGVMIENSGLPDIVRDIQWVYDHWGTLFVQSRAGTIIFDKKVLKTAPSQGAITMAEYALRKPDGFVERFVIKLLPKDAGNPEEITDQTQEERLAEMDPSFADMKDFFNQEVSE